MSVGHAIFDHRVFILFFVGPGGFLTLNQLVDGRVAAEQRLRAPCLAEIAPLKKSTSVSN